MKKLLRISLIIVSLTVAAFLIFIHVVDLQMDEEEMKEYFATSPLKPSFHTYEALGKQIHYVELGEGDKPLVVFVHGSPGSWDAYAMYMNDREMQQAVRMISIDRPGFGKSEYGQPEGSLKIQAGILRSLVESKRNGQAVILAGHSYGGPVIARFAMDYPALTNGLVFIAASVDPAQEKMMWIQRPLSWRILRWIIPKALDVSNREILVLKQELEEMLPEWQKVKAESVIIQGDKDRLVPAANADFIWEKLPNAPVDWPRLPADNHFVIWDKPDLIKQKILGLAACFQAQPSSD